MSRSLRKSHPPQEVLEVRGRSGGGPLLSRPLGKPERTRPGGAFGLVSYVNRRTPKAISRAGQYNLVG